jgi:transposase
MGLRGLLRGFGLKVGPVSKGQYDARIRALVAGHTMLEQIAEPMLRVRAALRAEFADLHRRLLGIVRRDEVCRLFMTVPGVGPVVAVTYKTAIDDPGRFRRSKDVGAHFGLSPKKYQSGETDWTGGISKVGDAMVRTALFEAATVLLSRVTRFSTLKAWAMGVMKRRGRPGLPWPASWPSYSIACGSMARRSAGARLRRRAQPELIWVGPGQCSRCLGNEVPSRGRGSGKPFQPEWPDHGPDHVYRDRLTRSL